MLPNGLIAILDMALNKSIADTELGRTKYALYILGMFREDVVYIPPLSKAFPSPSRGHIWPNARTHFAKLYSEAVQIGQCATQSELERTLSGAYALGRALHVLIDMACPAHANATWHYLNDPFERYVDAQAGELTKLSVPKLPLAFESAESLIESLATSAQTELSDLTQTPWGNLLRKFGKRKRLNREIIEKQAARLVPLAAAHVQSLFTMYETATNNVAI